MPIPASPMKVTCPICGWSRVLPQRSDVLAVPGACPGCAATDLDIRVAGPLDSPGALAEWIKGRLGKQSRFRR